MCLDMKIAFASESQLTVTAMEKLHAKPRKIQRRETSGEQVRNLVFDTAPPGFIK